MNDESLEISVADTDSAIETLALRVNETHAGARLDAYLAAHITDWSRAALKRLIEDGEVLVEGQRAKPAHKLRSGDLIEVELTAPRPAAVFAPENIPIGIVYEDETIVVINKPAGMVAHPAAGVASGTLANALAYHFERLSHNAGTTRPGIVHRLDRGTSGLMVVAKTVEAHERLSDQFRAREVFKSYVALVHGQVENDTGRIEQPIGRDPVKRTRMSVVKHGRPALSLYRVRRRYERFTLLDVVIKTGRTHQIRVHLAWMKHPVVGDALYGGGRDQTVANARLRAHINAWGRQFLHAEQLGFRHPRTQQPLHFRVPLAEELVEFLHELSA
jgi:23S rRNA pseudouridine1911/1915/1917 synthase